MIKIIKIMLALVLLIWAISSIKIVTAGKSEIVSRESIKVDSTLKRIEIVRPDEIQRLEDAHGQRYEELKREIENLKVRISILENKIEGGQ